MTGPASVAEALVDQLSSIACPMDRAEQISLVAKEFGNLPPVLAHLREDAVIEASSSKPVVEIAGRLSVTPGRIYQLLKAARTRSTKCAPPPSLPSDSGPLLLTRDAVAVGGGDIHTAAEVAS